MRTSENFRLNAEIFYSMGSGFFNRKIITTITKDPYSSLTLHHRDESVRFPYHKCKVLNIVTNIMADVSNYKMRG